MEVFLIIKEDGRWGIYVEIERNERKEDKFLFVFYK